MFCRKCGYELEENAKFCVNCGATVEEQANKEVVYVEPLPENKPAKVWDVFAKLGFGLGLGGLLGVFFTCGLTYSIAIPGIVFSILGKKSRYYSGKASAGLVMSIIGTIVGIIVFAIFYIIAIEEALEGGYYY